MPAQPHLELRDLGISQLDDGSFGRSLEVASLSGSSNIGKVAVSSAEDSHVTNIGTYLSARINGLKKGDVVSVALSGSAIESQFYYSIKEVTGNAKSLINNEQINTMQGRWSSIATNGLFEVVTDGIVVFSAVFRKGDVSGTVTVFHLGLIATVVGSK